MGDNNCFLVEELSNSYRMHNVIYREKSCTLEWGKERLNGGELRTQEEWQGITRDIPDAPAYFAALQALHECVLHSRVEGQRRLAERVRAEFEDDFRFFGAMTSSRVSDGKIRHQYCGSFGEPKYVTNMTFTSGFFDETPDALEAMLGTKDAKNTANVLNWACKLEGDNLRPYFLARGEGPVVVGNGCVKVVKLSSIAPARSLKVNHQPVVKIERFI